AGDIICAGCATLEDVSFQLQCNGVRSCRAPPGYLEPMRHQDARGQVVSHKSPKHAQSMAWRPFAVQICAESARYCLTSSRYRNTERCRSGYRRLLLSYKN